MSEDNDNKVHFIGDFEQTARKPIARAGIELHLRERAAADPEFRQALLADPRAVLKAQFGVDLPESTGLEVVEETASSITLVIPAESEEISDADLDAVAGGAALRDQNVSTLALGEEDGWSPQAGGVGGMPIKANPLTIECTPVTRSPKK